VEGGRWKVLLGILHSSRAASAAAVSSRPHHSSAREKKALAAWTCVRTPSRARRPARHARSHTCTHFKARLALTPLALFAPPLAVQPADIGARFRAGPPTPTTRRSRCFLQERGGAKVRRRRRGRREDAIRTRADERIAPGARSGPAHGPLRDSHTAADRISPGQERR